MFPYPSIKIFRLMLLFGFLLWGLTWVIEYYNYDVTSTQEDDILTWNYFGARLSLEASYRLELLYTASFGIGLLAMCFLKEWGRNLLVGAMILYALITPFMGIVVNTAIGDMLHYVTAIVIYIPVVLSFFDPCSEYFKLSKNVAEQGGAGDR